MAQHKSDTAGIDLDKLEEILSRWQGHDPHEALVPVIEEIQHAYGYLPEAAIDTAARRLGFTPTQAYGVLTFYSEFRLQPRGRRLIRVCEGSSCYFRGAARIGQAVCERLGIGYGETTADDKITLERADYCFGSCQVGPEIEINGRVFGHLTPETAREVVDQVLSGQIQFPEDGHHTPEPPVLEETRPIRPGSGNGRANG